MRPAEQSIRSTKRETEWPAARSVLPTILLQHVSEFDDKLALLILLRQFKSMFVLPAQSCFAVLTENVGNSMQPSQEDTLLCRSAGHIDDGVEEVRSSLTSLKGLADELVVTGQVCTAVDAAVGAMTIAQVGLKRLAHSLGVRCRRQQQQGSL